MNEHAKEWTWAVVGTFDPQYDATATSKGVAYGVDIKGPACGWAQAGTQSWEEYLASGPPSHIEMPASIAAEIRAFALEMTKKRGAGA